MITDTSVNFMPRTMRDRVKWCSLPGDHAEGEDGRTLVAMDIIRPEVISRLKGPRADAQVGVVVCDREKERGTVQRRA